MDKLPKVLEGLTNCLSLIRHGAEQINCEKCPYKENGDYTCETLEPLMKDAKELLNAAYPAPRPLTLDELRDVKPGTVLWFLYKNEEPYPVEFKGIEEYTFESPNGANAEAKECVLLSRSVVETWAYGKRYVLLTEKPTDEQRKATLWTD